MSLTAFVQQISAGHFRASMAQPIALVADGASREEALARLTSLAKQQLKSGEIVEIPLATDNPWAKFAGLWKDHPNFDTYQADITQYRQSADATSSP